MASQSTHSRCRVEFFIWCVLFVFFRNLFIMSALTEVQQMFVEFLKFSQIQKKNTSININREHFQYFLKSRGHTHLDASSFFLQNSSFIQFFCDFPLFIKSSEPPSFQTDLNKKGHTIYTFNYLD